MDPRYIVPDIQKALAEQRHPTVMMWNRLEGRPRSGDFERALRAEVRDGLWMLARQWQMGEFVAEDAGSPVLARVHVASTRLTRYRAGQHAVTPFGEVPLEPRVERRRIQLVRDGKKIQLDLRLQLGRHFGKLLVRAGLGAYRDAYRARYPFELPPQGRDRDDIYAHVEVWQELAAIAGRAIDGGELYLYLRGGPGRRASDGLSLVDAADAERLDALGEELARWFEELYLQPGPEDDAWSPPHLEYQLACSAPSGSQHKTLVADEYPGGHLDWYAFDWARDLQLQAPAGEEAEVEATHTRSFLPSPVTFEGMPNARWWKFEDGKTNFGEVTPTTTDLAKLLLMEFALVYANDWFVAPLRLPTATIASVRGLVVRDSFGDPFWIEPAGRGPDDDWQHFRMFTHSTRGMAGSADMSLLLAPSLPKIQEGEPLEEVFLVRDEVANMVWGIESGVPLATGSRRPGSEVAAETLAYHRRGIEAAPGPLEDWRAPISYLAMSSVPEHWIPFLPVHIEGSNREIQLQRAAMLRTLDRDPLEPQPIRPLTLTLREGLDEPIPRAYYLHEEEVPRAGAYVSRAFARTRGPDARVYVWLGMRKETGRGEAASRLGFDEILSHGS